VIKPVMLAGKICEQVAAGIVTSPTTPVT